MLKENVTYLSNRYFVSLVTEHRNSYSNLRLSDWFNRPVILEQGNNFDDLTRGLATQPELNSDPYSDSEVLTNAILIFIELNKRLFRCF